MRVSRQMLVTLRDVPAEAEIVIEGHVSLTETGAEGPYGDHTGFYNSVEHFPVFTASTRRFQRATSQNPGPRNSRHGRPNRMKNRFTGLANSGCWERMAGLRR